MRRHLMLIGLVSSLIMLQFASAANPEILQDEGRGSPLEHGRNMLYFYGIQDGSTTPSNWEVWNHADQSDADSDDSIAETNFPGAANNGGGSRSFDFLGSAPSEKKVLIDDSRPITGRVTIFIDCNQCSKEITVELKVGSRTYDRYTIPNPDEGTNNIYSISFDTNLDELNKGEAISLRLDFTKPAGLAEGYSINLGSGDFYLEVPTLPDPVITIPWTMGQEYDSPYSNSSNSFSTEEVGTHGNFMPILIGVLIVIGMVCTLAFAPVFPGKIVGTTLLGLCMITSFTIAPVMTGLDIPSEDEVSSIDVYTPDKLAELGKGAQHEFLSGFPNGSSFTFYVEFDQVHYRNVDGPNGKSTVYGLGFEQYSRDLSATATQPGMEQMQIWLSALEVDPSVGHAVSIEINIVEFCDPIFGCVTVPETLVNNNYALLPDGTQRVVIPESLITIHQVDRDWSMIPLYLGLLLGLGTVGIAIMLDKRKTRQWEEWQAWVEENGEDED